MTVRAEIAALRRARLARVEHRIEARDAARQAYEHWRALRRIAAEQHWRDVLQRLDEIELILPDPEEIE
jgi:hypothetical protein